GRAVAGIGGAWMELEHHAAGIDFGSGFGQRLDWMEETAAALETMFAGRRYTAPAGAHHAPDDFPLLPAPIQPRRAIMIGGSGEKKTLRSVALHADLWNAMGSREFLQRKIEILQGHCHEVGRDIAQITFTGGCKPIIRNTVEEATRVWEAQMANN